MTILQRLCLLMLAGLWTAASALAQLPAAAVPAKAAPNEIVLVQAEMVTSASVSQWKKERFQAVAVVLDERNDPASFQDVARRVSDGGLELYCWIEVGRNPKLAADHPEWMAALGGHDDWRKRFPNVPAAGEGQIAKAFPWVPIAYAKAFDTHLGRIDQLLQRAPPGWRGLFLNDLQGGPSSCGCGNLLCRWAIDYHTRASSTKLEGDDVAARFVSEVRRRVGEKAVIPIWTTECEPVDLPSNKNQGRPGTGLCGTVGCATGACPDEFTRQWSSLTSGHDRPVGLLAVHTAMQRTQTEFGGGPGWVTNAMRYLDQTLPANGAKTIPPHRLWVVVEGLRPSEEATAREVAAKAGVGAVIVARTSIDQSYEPRLFPAK